MSLDRLAVVIRSYNNPYIVKAVSRYLDMGVGKVYVVVNATPDKGATRAWLSRVNDHRLAILEITEGYNWSPALNRALAAVRIENIARPRLIEYIFNVSVEAQFTRDHLDEMYVRMSDGRAGIIGTSFELKQNNNVIPSGRSYRHPRNTGMLVRLSVFGVALNCFDAACDEWGGMEDIDFTLGMVALSHLRYEMLDLRVPLIVGVHYDQAKKEEREQAAMDKIIARWLSLFPVDSHEFDRISESIHLMRLARD